MIKKIFSRFRLGKMIATSAALSLAGFLFIATPALADIDPIGCTDNGGGISIAAFRSDGTTNIGSGTVTDGEVIRYRATISALGSPNCAFEDGTWTLTTPDGTVHPITPVGGVPRIGGAGVASVTSDPVTYTVDHTDEIVGAFRHIDAVTNYGGGISHADANDKTAGPELESSKILRVTHTPTVTTDVHDASHSIVTSVPIGSTVHDSANVAGVAGGPAPTGTVTFSRFTDLQCSAGETGAGTVALAGGVAHPSDSFTVTTAGGMAYRAHYNGDANYAGADGPCEPLSVDRINPTVTTDIHNAAHEIITSAANGSVVHDSATVAGTGPMPTGNVTFDFFTNGTCALTPNQTSGAMALVGGTVDATSFTQGPLSAGSYSFRAHYAGDTNYNPGDGPCEPLAITINQPTIATILSDENVDVGASVHDSAVLTGETADASGTVTYTVYTDNACSLGAVSAGTKTVTNGVVPDSDPVTFNTPGTYYWQATYSGDTNNAGPVSSPCQSEILVVNEPVELGYCSPGYWKQAHHFDSWVDYTPEQLFGTVFSDAFPNKSLVQVLSSGGGGLNALGRHVVAALLNNSADLGTGTTTAGVISTFNSIYAGAPTSGNTNSYYGGFTSMFTAPENCSLN